MQHAAGHARSAERVAVRATVPGPAGVDGDDLVGDLDDAVAEELDLLRVERVANDHEPVAVEQIRRHVRSRSARGSRAR